MGSSVPRRLATAAMLCALVAPLWAAPPAAAQRGYDEAEIRALFDGLRHGTMPSGLAGEECRRGMAATEDAEPLATELSSAERQVGTAGVRTCKCRGWEVD